MSIQIWILIIIVTNIKAMATFSKKPLILSSSSSAITTGISILSYNILLPNSMDGWWVYKCYSQRHKIEMTLSSWECRRALLEKEILDANADVVCLQEVCAGSFESDFTFMHSLGYDKHEMFRKGRFRPATFWRSNRVTQYGSSLHRDRCLVTAFHPTVEKFSDVTPSSEVLQDASSSSIQTLVPNPGTIPLEIIWVANCHLSAGGGVERNIRYL